jgi:CheY-like chemotaxis protein
VARKDVSTDPLRGLHILVVADDATVRRLVAGILAHGGALVTQAESAVAAALSLERVVPDVIACALALGHQVLHGLRAKPRPESTVPIVVLAERGDGHAIEVLEAGFAGYIQAPIDPHELCSLISDVADAHQRDSG